MRAESSLLELCRVQPIEGEANYELAPLVYGSSGVQEFGSSAVTIGCIH